MRCRGEDAERLGVVQRPKRSQGVAAGRAAARQSEDGAVAGAAVMAKARDGAVLMAAGSASVARCAANATAALGIAVELATAIVI